MVNNQRGEVSISINGEKQDFRINLHDLGCFKEMTGKDGFLLIQKSKLAYIKAYKEIEAAGKLNNEAEMIYACYSAIIEAGIDSDDLAALMYVGLHQHAQGITFDEFRFSVDTEDLQNFALLLPLINDRNSPEKAVNPPLRGRTRR
jgi:hypothetical protein